MPEIEYDIQSKKIKRKFTPAWAKSGKVDIDEVLPKYIDALITQRKSMVSYIELLHNEIDRLQDHIGKETKEL